MLDKTVFAFDIGLGSLGEAVRKGREIVHADSLLIDADVADLKDERTRRRAYRTRESHKMREAKLIELWEKIGSDASEESHSKKIRQEIEANPNAHFACISYRDEILPWLGRCIEISKDSEKDGSEEVLRSGLLQFKDAVEGLCSMRKIDTNRRSKVIEEFLKLDEFKDKSIDKLAETRGRPLTKILFQPL